jgi:hypothetical protein
MPKINKIDTHRSDAATKNGYEENCDSKFSAIEDNSITTYTRWLMIFTGLLVVCNILLWLSTKKSANAAKKSIELTKQEFITTHRPKLRVHSVCLKKSDSTPKLNGGSYITHQLHYSIDNIGGSTATITKQSMAFKRLNKPLPVPSYYDPMLIEKTIACGESIADSFGVEDALIWSNKEREIDDLCFFGYIDYRDNTRTTRRTAFCRRYVRETGRFTKIEDEDYEYSY